MRSTASSKSPISFLHNFGVFIVILLLIGAFALNIIEHEKSDNEDGSFSDANGSELSGPGFAITNPDGKNELIPIAPQVPMTHFRLNPTGVLFIDLEPDEQVELVVEDIAHIHGRIESKGHVSITAREIVVGDTSVIKAQHIDLFSPSGEGTISGKILAKSSDEQIGGNLNIYFQKVKLRGAFLDASGQQQGGTVQVVWEKTNPEKKGIFVDPDTVLAVSSNQIAGNMLLESSGDIDFFGTIIASGHSQGGRVKISSGLGATGLSVQGCIDVTSKNGKEGSIELDGGSNLDTSRKCPVKIPTG